MRPLPQLLLLLLSELPTLSEALRHVVGAEFLSSFEIPRGTVVGGALFPVGGLSGLASDGTTIYAVSDRGDIFTATVAVSDAGQLTVELQGAFHVGVAGGNVARPAYVDVEGIAVCGGQQGRALLVSTEDPPRVFRLNRADGSAWAEATPLPVQLEHIVNTSSTRQNGQLESLSCWSDTESGSSGTIYTANEAPLQQDSEPRSLWDAGAVGPSVRIFSVDRSSGAVRRTTRYMLDRRSGNGLARTQVDVEAVGPNGSLITMERAFESGVGNTIRIFAVDSVTAGGGADATACASVSEASGCAAAVPKRLLMDLGATAGIPLDNFEGMALLGTPLADGRRVLLLVNDDNFSPGQLPTTFIAVALTEEEDATLPTLGKLVGTIQAAAVTPLPDGSATPSAPAVELVVAYRGIPYALPPVGHRRYDRPFPPGTGQQLGAACPQTPWLSYYGPEPTSEDCLFLNVFTPSSSANGGDFPVLVFLHGGSWLWGSSSVFDGTKLAAAEGMVVVTVNYRLGALGMMPTPPDVPGGMSEANYGLLDQQLALRWVQKHAGAFGGDVSRVMLVGESAGAAAVLLHLALPGSGPGTLYQSAAVHSAPCVEAPHRYACVSALEEMERTVAVPLAAAAGCAHTDRGGDASGLDATQLACLRAQPVETIVELASQLQGASFHPAMGVSSVPTDPIATLITEGTAVERVILGWNKHDGSQFAPHTWAADSETNVSHCCPVPIPAVSQSDWEAQLQNALPGVDAAALAEVDALYAPFRSEEDTAADHWWRDVALITDLEFGCPTLRLAEKLGGGSGSVRVFEFNQRSAFSGAPPRWGVYHASDLQYLFDVRYPYLLGASGFTQAERVLQRSMMQLWARSARGKLPDDDVTWPSFRAERAWSLQIGPTVSVGVAGSGAQAVDDDRSGSGGRCEFWEAAGYYQSLAGASSGNGIADGGESRQEGERPRVVQLGLNIGAVVLFCVVIGATAALVRCSRKRTHTRYASLQRSDSDKQEQDATP